jgi:hypothetical protein
LKLDLKLEIEKHLKTKTPLGPNFLSVAHFLSSSFSFSPWGLASSSFSFSCSRPAPSLVHSQPGLPHPGPTTITYPRSISSFSVISPTEENFSQWNPKIRKPNPTRITTKLQPNHDFLLMIESSLPDPFK